jgi:phosphatidylglycerol lysyltransferase
MSNELQHQARKLLLRFGWNSTCFQILNPGIRLWLSADAEAVVGYVLKKGVRVVAGAPVCDASRISAVLTEWEADADASRHRVCYFGAEGRMQRALETASGYTTVTLGAQPSWNPQHWPKIFDGDRNLRAQRNRALHKGIRVEEWGCDTAMNHPALRICLHQWLATRGLPPMHFLVEPETLESLEGRRTFVALNGKEVVGFLVLSPIPQRAGWLTEQFPRGASAPNGTVELLMDHAIRAVGADGAEYVTMGIIPLSRHGIADVDANPDWLRFTMTWVRAHGRRFYNFDGLDRFKLKFRPEYWEPICVISKEPRFSLRTLYAIASAFSDGPPVWSLARGLSKAARREADWFLNRNRPILGPPPARTVPRVRA